MKVVLKVAYEGGAFAGFQRQSSVLTVQGALETALSLVLTHPVALVAAGRTDVGVHGTGQVIAFQTASKLNLARLCHSVNSVLQGSVRVTEAALLDADDPFHPRYSALARTYSYFVMDGSGPAEPLFWRERAWCIPQRLDLDLARQASALFLGEHDFTTFSYKMVAMETRVRAVSALELSVEETPGLIFRHSGPRIVRLSITANGFLRRMVRLITAGVVEVATGLRTLEDLRARLEVADSARAPHPAPPHGLYLEHIRYDPDPFESQRGTPRHAKANLPANIRVKR